MDTITNQISGECEEVDLWEIGRVLLKRKWLIFLLTLSAALAAYAISHAQPKVYQIGASLQIGTIVDDRGVSRLIESADQIKEKKDNDVYGVLVREKLGISQGDYPHIVTQIGKDTAIISFSAESANVDLAKKIFQELSDVIVADHEKAFDNARQEAQKNIDVENDDKKRLMVKIELLANQQAIIEQKVSSLEKIATVNFDSGNELVLLNTKEQLLVVKQDAEDSYSKINEADRKIFLYQRYMNDMQPTRMIKKPYSSESPISPHVTLDTMIGAVVGFFIGAVLAFFVEHRRKS